MVCDFSLTGSGRWIDQGQIYAFAVVEGDDVVVISALDSERRISPPARLRRRARQSRHRAEAHLIASHGDVDSHAGDIVHQARRCIDADVRLPAEAPMFALLYWCISASAGILVLRRGQHGDQRRVNKGSIAHH
jgi:hypothetical protein